MTHPDDILRQAESLYEQRLYASAFRVAEQLGKLGKWPGVRGRLLAGRLAIQLGRPSWGNTLHRLALREYPLDPSAIYYGALAISSRRGPVRTWLEFRNVDLPSTSTAEQRGDWLAFKGSLLASLRDFDRAQKLIDQSLEIDPQSAWNHLVYAALCRHRDQPDQAIALCEKALQLHPHYRPALQSLAELLWEANRDNEAYQLLKREIAYSECPLLIAQQILLCQELEKYEETLELLKQYQELAILSPAKPLATWLYMVRSRVYYMMGRYEEAIDNARKVDLDYSKRFADRLERCLLDQIDPQSCRVRIPVSFVRQNRSTCAPATLAALSGYWQKPIKHEEIADRICYDGTLSHDERLWAVENGFVAREFCITSQAAHDLINAGIPFSLTTVSSTSGHLQAVVGYDSIGENLLIRDPSNRDLVEATTDKLLEYYASSGPRGMLLIPQELAGRLDPITLPEAEIYDLQYQIDLALNQHRRDQAIHVLEKLRNQAPDHRLTLQSEFSIKRYDGNTLDCLRIIEKMLEKYPKDLRLILIRLDYCQEFGTRSERIDFLQKALTDFGPVLRLKTLLAEEYLNDSREYHRAELELRWLMRWAVLDSQAISLYGQLAWKQQRYDDSLELLRIAACNEDKSEEHAQTFFTTALRCRQMHVALAWLKERHEQWGKQNCGPCLTLAWAYEVLQDIPACFATLQEAIRWRPSDGHLLCNAALFYDRYGEHEIAQCCVELAAEKANPAVLIRAQATLALNAGRLSEARERFQELLAISPFDRKTLDTLLELDLQLEDANKGEQRLRDLVARWPNNTQLHERLVAWLRQFGSDALQAELAKALKNDANNPWLHREAAIAALQSYDTETAIKHIELCIELEPNHHRNWLLMGQVYLELGDRQRARESAQRSLKLWVDNDPAMELLISTCRSEEDFTADFGFLLEQLRTQMTFGDGILSYFRLAKARRDANQVLKDMREAHHARPDLWQTWTSLIRQYVHVGRTDQAYELAQQFTKRFPYSFESWLELAYVCSATNKPDLQCEALERAFQINPTSAEITYQLSDLYLARKDIAKSLEILNKGIAFNPREAVLYGYLAEIQWNQNQPEAIETIRKAVTINPGYTWAWNAFGEWCHEMGMEQLAFDTAQSLMASKLSETWGYVRTAELHLQWDRPEDACRVAQQGLSLDPLEVALHEINARSLWIANKINEALEACRPNVFRHDIPAKLMFLESEILFKEGHIKDAIKRKRCGLELAPNNYMQWRSLLDWTSERNDAEDHFRLCEKFVALFPADAVAHGFLADALQKLKPEESQNDCIKEFETALQLDSSYAFAAYELFFLYLKTGKIADAQRLRQDMPGDLSPAILSTLSMWLECCETPSDLTRVLRLHITDSLKLDVYSLRRGLDCLRLEHWQTAIESLWKEQPHLPALGVLWAETMAKGYEPALVCEALQKLPLGEAWAASWEALQNMPPTFQIPVGLVQDINNRFRKTYAEREALESAIRNSPDWGELRQKLADNYLACGENENAIIVLKKGLDRMPFDASLHAQLAGILWNENRKREAIDAMRLAVTLNPGYSWAWEQFAKWCYESGVEKEAFDAAKTLLKAKATEVWGHIRTAELHLRWYRPKTACTVAIDGLKLEPNNVKLREIYARSLYLSGRTGEALEVCHPSIAKSDLPVELMFLESEILFRTGKIPESIKRRKLALDKKPINYEQWCVLLRLTSEHSASEDHLQLCKRFLNLFPSDAIAHGLYATALQRSSPEKSTLECIEKFQAALRFDPNYSSAALELFFLYLKIGRIGEAQKLHLELPQTLSTQTRSTLALWLDCCVAEGDVLAELCKRASLLTEIDPLSLKRGLEVLKVVDRQSKLDTYWKEAPDLATIGIIWAELKGQETPPPQIIEKLRTLPHGKAWLAAWTTLLENPKPWRFPVESVQEIHRQFRMQISKDAPTWAAVSKYYWVSKNLKLLNEWTSNWRSIPFDHQRQLTQAIAGQWLTKNEKEARHMLDKAASIPAASPDPYVQLWQATSKIYQGQCQHVLEVLESLRHDALDHWHMDLREYLQYLANYLAEIENASSSPMRQTRWEAIAIGELEHSSAISSAWKRWYLMRVKENSAIRFKLWGPYIKTIVSRLFSKH